MPSVCSEGHRDPYCPAAGLPAERIHQEELSIRVKRRCKWNEPQANVAAASSAPNERWSMDFITDQLHSGR